MINYVEVGNLVANKYIGEGLAIVKIEQQSQHRFGGTYVFDILETLSNRKGQRDYFFMEDFYVLGFEDVENEICLQQKSIKGLLDFIDFNLSDLGKECLEDRSKKLIQFPKYSCFHYYNFIFKEEGGGHIEPRLFFDYDIRKGTSLFNKPYCPYQRNYKPLTIKDVEKNILVRQKTIDSLINILEKM